MFSTHKNLEFGILLCASLIMMFAGLQAMADQADFSAYERDIVERKPFGETPPAPPPPPPPPPKEPPSVIDSLDIVAITDGLRVGFINRKSKREYYLAVGEEEDGIKVAAIYPELETVVFEAAGKEKKKTMSQTDASRFGTASSAGTATARSDDKKPAPHSHVSSYKERLKARQEALQKKREEEKDRMTREQFRELYDEIQKEKSKKSEEGDKSKAGKSGEKK